MCRSHKDHLAWQAMAHLDLLWDSGVNAMCFSSQISSSSEPPSSNCCIRSLQHASNRAILPYRKKGKEKRKTWLKSKLFSLPSYQWKLFLHLLFKKMVPITYAQIKYEHKNKMLASVLRNKKFLRETGFSVSMKKDCTCSSGNCPFHSELPLWPRDKSSIWPTRKMNWVLPAVNSPGSHKELL